MSGTDVQSQFQKLDTQFQYGKAARETLTLTSKPVFTDLRVIDLYEDATIDYEAPEAVPLAERKGNWVQKFHSNNEGITFVSAQFFRYQEVEEFIRDNFEDGEPFQKNGGVS